MVIYGQWICKRCKKYYKNTLLIFNESQKHTITLVLNKIWWLLCVGGVGCMYQDQILET